MQARQWLAPGAEIRQRLSRRRRLGGLWVPAALWLCVQAAAPGIGHGARLNLGPNEIQSGYRDVLSILATGDREGALEALFEFEIVAVGEQQPWKRVENFWRLKLRTLREMLDAESLDLLKPVIMLHHDANRMYREKERPFLASHSRIMATELAVIYADRADTSAAREFSGWVMTSLGAMLWHPSSVVSSADLFYQAQRLDPANPAALMGLGAAYERNADYEKAMEYFSRLLVLDPGDSEASLHMAMCQIRSGEVHREQGLATLKSLQRQEGASWVRSVAYQEVARAQLADEDLETAEATLREGLEVLPEDQQLSMQLALLLDGRRRQQEALELVGRIDPGNGQRASPRLMYDVWEPTGMQDIRARLWKDAAAALPLLAEKLNVPAPEGWGE